MISSFFACFENGNATNPTPLPTPEKIWQAVTPVAEPTLDSDEIIQGHPFRVHWGKNIQAGSYSLFRRLEPTQTWSLLGVSTAPTNGYYSVDELSTLETGHYYYRVHPFGGSFDQTDEGTPQPGWIGGVHIVTRTPTPAPTAFGTEPDCGSYSEYKFVLNESHMHPVDCEIADINGDDDPDMVFACRENNEIVGFISDSGSFSLNNRVLINGTGLPQDQTVTAITAGDLDNDDDIDIVVTYESDDTVIWLENDGNDPPQFSPNIITSSDGVTSMSLHMINADDDLDILAYSPSGIYVFMNDGNANPTFSKNTITQSSESRSVSAADMDGDGKVDIIRGLFVTGVGGQLSVHYNPGGSNPTFDTEGETIVDSPNLLTITHIVPADFDNDGDTDIALSRNLGGYTGILWVENCNCPDGFQEHVVIDDIYTTLISEIKVADWDQDGFLDIFAYSTSDDQLYRFMNSGSNNPFFTQQVLFGEIPAFRSFEVADVDLDLGQYPNIVYCAYAPGLEPPEYYPAEINELGWIENTFHGTCSPPPVTPTLTPTPTYYPTPKQIWELAPTLTQVHLDGDFVASTEDYSVHFGGNLPNLPNHYKIYKKSNPQASFASISPTLVYDDETNSFGFNQTASSSDSHPLFKVEVTDWQNTPIPGGSVEQDDQDPRQWKQGIAYNTPAPSPAAPTPFPPYREISISIESTEDFGSADLPDVDNWPVTTAIPFPPGEVFDWHLEGFRIKNSVGTPVPAQFRVKEHWPDSSNSIRWLQLDFQVTMATIEEDVEGEYKFVYDPTVDNPEPTDPLRIYESLTPLFQLDFEHPGNPTIATIGDPGKEAPSNSYDIPNGIGCGYGYDPQGMGKAMDASSGDTHLTYITDGNFDMSHGTIEFWYKPTWSMNPVAISEEPVIFSLKDPTSTTLNSLKIYFLLTQGSSAKFRADLEDDTPGSSKTLSTDIALSLSNWNDLDWNHLTVSWDGSQGLRAFLNGQLLDDDRQPFQAYDEDSDDVPSEFTIGYLDWGTPDDKYYTRGYVDDFRIFEDFTEELTFTQQTLRLSFDDFVDGIPEVPISRGFIQDPATVEKINPALTPTPVSREELGVQNSAVVFYGNEYLKLNNKGIAYPRYLGVDFWFRIDDSTENQALFHIHTTANPHYPNEDVDTDGITCKFVPGNPPTIDVKIDDGEGGAPQPITLSVDMDSSLVDKWHHLAFLARDYNLPTIKCDFDEVEIPPEEGDWETDGGFKLILDGGYSEDYEAWFYPLTFFPSKEIWIGALHDGTSMVDLEGAIDEFRIWNYPRMPREKISAFCADSHFQIRMDRMNHIDLSQIQGKLVVDGRDLESQESGFVVKDKKIVGGAKDTFVSSLNSYYMPGTVYEAKTGSTPGYSDLTVYSKKYSGRRLKVNDFSIAKGPLRTYIDVRSHCKSDTTDEESGYGISRYNLYPGTPFAHNDFTFVITRPSNPDPGLTGSSTNTDARKYRSLSIDLNTNNALEDLYYGYEVAGSPFTTTISSPDERFVFQSYTDVDGDTYQHTLTPVPRTTLVFDPDPGTNPTEYASLPTLPAPAVSRTPKPDEQKRYIPQLIAGDASTTTGTLEGWIAYNGTDRALVCMMSDLPEMYPKVFSQEGELSKIHLWGYKSHPDATFPDNGVGKIRIDDESIKHFYFLHQGSYDAASDSDPNEEAYLLDFNVPSTITKHGIKTFSRHDHHRHAMAAEAMGLSRSHEMLLYPFSESIGSGNLAEIRAINKLFQSSVFGIPDPTHMCRGYEDEQLRPYIGGSTQSNNVLNWVQNIDKSQRESFDAWLGMEHWTQPIGMFNWIDHPTEWSFSANRPNGIWRIWGGNRHRLPTLPWVQFFRTGDAGYLKEALRNSRKVTDTYWIHWDGRGEGISYLPKGGQRKYNGLVPYSTDLDSENQMTYNSQTDYLNYVSYFTGSPWGTETGMDFIRAIKGYGGAANDYVARYGAGAADAKSSIYPAAVETLNSDEKTTLVTDAFLEKGVYGKDDNGWGELQYPTGPSSFTQNYTMIKGISKGGRYHTDVAGWRPWSLWLNRLFPLYRERALSQIDEEPYNAIKSFIARFNQEKERRRESYDIQGMYEKRFDLAWGAIALNYAEDLMDDENLNVSAEDIRTFIREDWHYLDRVFRWSIYNNENSIYDKHHFAHGGPAHGSYDTYTYIHLALWLSALIKDQEQTIPIVPSTTTTERGEWGPGQDNNRFEVGVEVANTAAEVCTNGPSARPSGMKISFSPGSTIRAWGGYKSPTDPGDDFMIRLYPHVFMNFDDRSNAPSGTLGATIYTGSPASQLNQWKLHNDFGRYYPGKDPLVSVADPEDALFGQRLDISEGEGKLMLVDTGPVFSSETYWTVSFWMRRKWTDSAELDPYILFNAQDLIIQIERTGSEVYKLTATTGTGSNISISTVSWEMGDWKKIIFTFNSSDEASLFLLNRHGCSEPLFSNGTVTGVGSMSPVSSVSIAGSGSSDETWASQFDNILVDAVVKDGLDDLSDENALTYFVYKTESGSASDYLYDADYDKHMCYIQTPSSGDRAYTSLEVYPGKRGTSNPTYYLMSPVSKGSEEEIEILNSRASSSEQSKTVFRERAPILLKDSDYGTNAIILNSGLAGEFEQYSVVRPDETPIPQDAQNIRKTVLDWSGYSSAVMQSPGAGRPDLSVEFATPVPTPTRFIVRIDRPKN